MVRLWNVGVSDTHVLWRLVKDKLNDMFVDAIPVDSIK